MKRTARDYAKVVAAFLVILCVEANALSAERLWVYSTTGGYLDSSPAIGDVDRDGSPDIVVTSTAGPVFALDALGHEIWRTDLDETIGISPTVVDIVGDPGLEVLVLTQTGRLVCLEGLTGDVIWESTRLADVKWGAMTVIVADLDLSGTPEIVTGDMAGTLLCLDAEGEVVWTYEESEGIGSAPAVGDLDRDGLAEIVLATPETPLLCVDHTGTLLWRMTETTDTWGTRLHREVSAPVIWDLEGDGRPEVLVGIGSALAAVTGDGRLLWSYPMANQIDSAISVADADGDGAIEVYAADLSGKFACVSAEGQEKWSISLGSRARRSPTIADVNGDGVVEILAAGYSQSLAVLDPQGEVQERLVVNAGTNASATLADLRGDGGLCAVIPEISGDLVVYRWEPSATSGVALWPEYRFGPTRTASAHASSDRKAVAGVTAVELGDYYAPSAVFAVHFANPERTTLTTRLAITRDGTTLAERVKSTSRRRAETRLPYEPASVAGGRVQFSYEVATGDATLARRTYTVDVDSFEKTLEGLNVDLQEVASLVPMLPDSCGMVEQAHYLRAQAGELAGLVEGVASLSMMERRALRDELNALGESVLRPLALARQAVKEEEVLVVYAANPWAPFGGMDEILEGRTPAIAVGGALGAVGEVEAFHGEVESAAFNVFNFGSDTLTLRATMDDLACKDSGAVQRAAEVVTLREVVAVPTQRMDKSADALPKMGQGQTLVVPPWDARQLWLTIDASKLSPGTWRGNVHFRSLDVMSLERVAELRVTVWNAALPEEQPLWFCNWTSTSDPEGALEDLVAHGTNVFTGGVPAKARFTDEGELDGEIDFAAHDAFMKRHGPHGLVLFHSPVSLSGPAPAFSPLWQKAYNRFADAWVKHMAELGFGYESFALYPVDEPGLADGRRVETFLKWAKATHEADPKIRTYANPVGHITMDQLNRMAPYVDIWAPLHVAGWAKGEPEKLAFMHATGAAQWNYSCAHDAKHQSPLGYYRAQSWMVWSFGHTGIGVYTYHRNGDAAWFFQTGDYDMVYKGEGVVTSKRWEAMRDGVEDYAMLHALRAASEAPGVDPEIRNEARRLYEERAAAIGKFCNWEGEGTVPGKEGMPAARALADEQWQTLRRARLDMAALFVMLELSR